MLTLSYILVGVFGFFLLLVIVRLLREFSFGDWLFRVRRESMGISRKALRQRKHAIEK